MAVIVELPRLSDTMEEGVIAKWHVGEGDKVKRGQVIADIETDKATMEFESFDAGIVLKLVAPEGEALPLGAPIAVLGKPGEDVAAALEGHTGNGSPAPTAAAPAAAPVAPPVAAAPAATAEPSAAPTSPDDDRIPASPIARRLAREHGFNLADIAGTGPHGRVVKTDVEAAAMGGPVARPTPSTTSAPRADTEVKLSQMRKAIARRMAQANTEIPHFYLTIAVDMAAAVATRTQLKVALPDVKISFNDFIVMGCAKALAVHPEINAYWNGKTIVRRGDIHVGVAVALDDGLIVPVVRNTDRLTLREIAIQTRDLGTRARDKQLGPAQMSGSSFTISNLGMFGIEDFAAVVNPGEGAILAVGAITDEVVVVDGQPGVGKRMRVTLSCDHRVMDGAMGARFLATLRGLLEQPLSMMA